jgi:putative ABC transport system permease protein
MHLKQTLRRLVRMPLFSSVAVLTLAVGIGANTAIFSVIQGILLKPLPYPRSDELVTIDHAAPGINLPSAGAAPFLYFTYREQGRTFQDVGLWNTGTVSVTGLAEPEEVPTLFVTDAVLPVLGVRPQLGRIFTRTDATAGGPETVVLTSGYWRSKFGGDPSVVGRTLMVNSTPREIIGVLPDTFRFLDRSVSIVVPYQMDRGKTFLGQFSFNAIGRLKPGVTYDQATADAARMIPVSFTLFPPLAGLNVKMFEEARLTPRVVSLKDDLVGDIKRVLWVLMGTIGLVLLVACANVANLLLVRAESRQQELAVRAALGAGTKGIARELLLESMTLALLGGVVGLALAFGALRLLIALAPGNLPRLEDITLDVTVLGFTLVVSVFSGLFFGSIPVLKYARTQPGIMLRGGGRSASASRSRHRARNTLVVAQVAVALVLLVSSGLMIRTFQALRDVHPGFARPHEVQTVRLSIPDSQVKEPEAVVRMQQAIVDKMASVPGVASIAIASTVTMSGNGWHDPVFAADRTYSESQVPPIRLFKFVSPGYVQTMGASLVAGRDFTWTDTYGLHPVAMVSENLARELWSEPSNAVGKRIRPYPKGPWREVVGVVSDMRDDGLHEKASATAYWPLTMAEFSPLPADAGQNFVQRSATFIVRSSRTGSSGFVEELGKAIWSINPHLPLASVRTLQDVYDASLARTSFTLVMLAIAGGMALLLGVAGIYGVMSYSASQRTREIGIRVALGAQARAVTNLFVSHGLMLAGIGIAIGLAAAIGIMRLMSSLLFEVNPVDPMTYTMVSLMLMAAAALASYVPALRAAAMDPLEALRAE